MFNDGLKVLNNVFLKGSNIFIVALKGFLYLIYSFF